MNLEKSIQVLLLIATVMSYITPKEATRKTSKLRRHIRLSLDKLSETNPRLCVDSIEISHRAWETAKEKLANENYTISIDTSCRALYSLLNTSPARNIWFSEKTFEDAMQSIYENGTKSDDADIENNSNMLIDIFAEALDIKRDNRLKVLKQTVEMNQILEGK